MQSTAASIYADAEHIFSVLYRKNMHKCGYL